MTIHTLYISAGIDHTWDETLDLQPMFAKRDFEKLSQDDEAHDCKTDVYNLLDIVQKYAGDLDRVFDHIESIHLVEDYDIFFYKDVSPSDIWIILYKLIERKEAQGQSISSRIIEELNSVVATRSTSESVLWTVGCSQTVGVGLDYKDRWGTILSKKLGMPEVSLSLGGTSITWAADQLLRSDVRKGDIVVWGLTNGSRVDYCHNKVFSYKGFTFDSYEDKLPKEKKMYNVNYFDSVTHDTQSARAVLQCINFCKKIGAELYFANILNTTGLPILLKDNPNYINFNFMSRHYSNGYISPKDLEENRKFYLIERQGHVGWLDLASDNCHSGPLQNKYQAEELYKLIKGNRHGKAV